MMSAKILAATALGLAVSACSYSSTTREAPAPVAVVPATATTTYVAPAAATTTVYTPARTVTYVPAATDPPVGQQAFRDEYGFRYDGRGNRLDARGNIISPQSKIP